MHYYLFSDFCTQENTAKSHDYNQNVYERFVNGGHLTETDGDEIKFDFVRDEILEDFGEFDIPELAYDPAHATHLAQQLDEEGMTVVEYPNRLATMSEPMKELEAAIYSGRFKHNNNEVMNWNIANTVVSPSRTDDIRPLKEKPDPVHYLIN